MKSNISARYKLTIIATVLLALTGIFAFIYDPEYIDKLGIYLINTVLPVLGFIAGRTLRGQGKGEVDTGAIPKSTRFRSALYTFLGSLILGIVAYIYSPENIDKFGMFMLGVVFPVVGYILGRSFKGASDSEKTE